jgi:hypothetical protein
MTQQVTVTSDSPIELKPLIESAIRSELRILALGLERTKQRLQAFEERYGLTSEDFERRLETGEIEESLDFIEWAGEINTYQHLDAQRKVLQKVELN